MLDADRPVGGRPGPLAHRVNISVLIVSVCALFAGLSCPSETAEFGSVPSGPDGALTIFLTGSELGSLRPCGCSGGQLGGLEKRPAVFDTVPASRRLIVETGGFVQNDREQDLMKFGILFEALRLLGYDTVHLTNHDVGIAERLGLLTDTPQPFEIFQEGHDGQSPVFVRRFESLGRDVLVNIASFDPHVSPLERAGVLFKEAPGALTVDILILRHCDPGSLGVLAARLRGVECVVCPSDTDEPRLLSGPGEIPLVFTVGRFGRHICRLDVAFPEPRGEPVVRFEPIPVEATLADDEALLRLYSQYQQLVSSSTLLEDYPRIPLPQGLAFAGSKSCERCHEYEYDMWSTKAHADALASLNEVGSDRDPECVICHVVGMNYDRGFISQEKTPHLKDVGCENCHGPGSEHIRTLGQVATRQPQMACLDCHTPEKSTGFAGHEEEYMQKIVHWREPAADRDVKE